MPKYSMRVAWSKPDQMFVATCPELGDLSALGNTQEKAIQELKDAVELAEEVYHETGRELPPPNLCESYSGQFRLRIPKTLHAWLVATAQHEGISLNSFVSSVLSDARGQAKVASFANSMFKPYGEELREIVGQIRIGLMEYGKSKTPTTATGIGAIGASIYHTAGDSFEVLCPIEAEKTYLGRAVSPIPI